MATRFSSLSFRLNRARAIDHQSHNRELQVKENNMKKFLFLLASCSFVSGFSTDVDLSKEPFGMHYYAPDSKLAYSPNMYRDFKYDIVHTKQLEIEEYLLQRNDWQFIKLSEINDSVKKLPEINDSVKQIKVAIWILVLLNGFLVVRSFTKTTSTIRQRVCTKDVNESKVGTQTSRTVYDTASHTYKRV